MNIQDLREKLSGADQEYYDNTVINPSLTDQEYDNLVKQYKKLTGESWMAFGSLGTHKHKYPMLSLDKAHTEQDMIDFKTNKQWSDNLIVMPKLDGGALSIESLNLILTRGKLVSNVSYGENITKQAIRIPGVKEAYEKYSHLGVVRGEVVLPRANLELINKSLDDKDKYVNCRNACTGIMKNQSNTSLLKYLMFIPYLAVSDKGVTVIGDHIKQLDSLNYEDLNNQYQQWLTSLDFDIDGIVLHCKDLAGLPPTTRYPVHSLALKFKTETAETVLREILWSAGRTGRVTPVGIFDPVELDGTTVTRCTLHNLDQLTNLGITEGSRVELFKSGQIIPQVYKVLEAGSNQLKVPTTCPECSEPLNKLSVDLVCNNVSCPVKIIDGLVFNFNKSNLDVDGTGEEAINILVNQLGFKTLLDVYRLTTEPSLVTKLGNCKHNNISFGIKRANKLRDALLISLQQPWNRLLHSLGIPGLGHDQASSIAFLYSLDELSKTSVDELVSIKGIGLKTAQEIRNWFDTNQWATNLSKLFNTNKVTQAEKLSGPLDNQVICITGTFSISRNQIEKILVNNGASVSKDVNKQTTILIAGDKAGSKLEKAKKLNIKIEGWEYVKSLL